jgi:hypothetical protein
VRAGRPCQFDEDTFRRRDGSMQPVWWATTPLRDQQSGGLLGAVLVFGDTTRQRARAVAEAADREQDRADLAEARRSIDDLVRIGQISQALSSTLDESEVLVRLSRLLVPRLADVAVADLIGDDGVVRRVACATADGADVDPDELLARCDVAGQFDDPAEFGPPTSAVLDAVDSADAIAVPMIARGHLVAALGLIRLAGSPPFDRIDRLIAAEVCQRAALAVDNARLFRAQTDIASRLQQALLPTLPADMLVRAAVRYLPARERFEVGGDWYDVFRTPEGGDTTVLVVGDVAGHDLSAGTTMSALRNLLRGVAVATQAPPAALLGQIDGNLDALGIRGTATTLLMTVRPTGDGSWSVTWSNAGHMPPLLFMPDREVELLGEVHGPLLGTGVPQPRTETERAVPAGSTVVLYTDGLVETPDAAIDTSLTRLRRAALALTAPLDDPEAIADELVARIRPDLADDTAMLVCHLPELGA